MYSTCIFCSAALGSNESLESFPVGRRLAFDAAQGRLWVVCRACGRWNLSPLEERWEAIEACERRFRDTRVRVSTEHIGLARLPDGLELVRVGRPLRPEFAAWRYGDQFGRRRLRNIGIAALGLTALGGFYFGGVFGGGPFTLWLLYNGGRIAVNGSSDKVLATLERDGRRINIKREHLPEIGIRASDETGWQLVAPIEKRRKPGVIAGPEAVYVAGRLLAGLNRYGGTGTQIRSAVNELETTSHPADYFRRIATDPALRDVSLPRLPATVRLAIEMAAHEEAERRALEGELAELEQAWRSAEEIAAIADSLLLPTSLTDRLRALRSR